MRKGEKMKMRKGVKGRGSLKLKQDKKTTTEQKIGSKERHVEKKKKKEMNTSTSTKVEER
jgi:hypothetical protein